METSGAVFAEHRTELRKPGLYAVVMHNDEITTMDFVVEVLVKVFNKGVVEATEVMMDIHEKGQGVAGVYVYDVAVTKKLQAEQLAAEKCFPLALSVREAL